MHKTIFMVLLAAMSNGAVAVLGERGGAGMAAKWVMAGDSEIYTAYADPGTLLKDGNLKKIWELLDLRKVYQLANGEPHMSIKRQSEYDCKRSRWRTLYLYFYSGNMGTGDMVYRSVEPDNWHPIPIGSVGDALRQFACGNR